MQTFKAASGNDFKTHIEVHDLRQQLAAVSLERFTTISVNNPIPTPRGATKTTGKSWEM